MTTTRRKIENWYIKDTGDGQHYMSGMAIPRDADGVTRNIDFSRCDWHYASFSIFENCTDNGSPLPDGPCHVRYFLDLPRLVQNVLVDWGKAGVLEDRTEYDMEDLKTSLPELPLTYLGQLKTYLQRFRG